MCWTLVVNGKLTRETKNGIKCSSETSVHRHISADLLRACPKKEVALLFSIKK